MGCCLAFVLEQGLNDLDEDDVEAMLRFANAVTTLVISQKGALLCRPNKSNGIKSRG